MTDPEIHQPFIKSLLIVAFVTIFAMVSSRFIVDYYSKHSFYPFKTMEYSSQKSYENDISPVND
jgi:hypothetical protein